MQIKHHQLLSNTSSKLADTLVKLIVINGDEDLLVEESLDYLRALFKNAGYQERLSYTLSAQYNWNDLSSMGSEMSLFAEHRLIEVRVNGKLGAAGSKAILEYLNTPSSDDTWVIILPKLDFQQRKSKWYKAVLSEGWMIDVDDVNQAQFPQWLKQRLQSRALRVESGVVEMLQAHLEGNILAAAQEIDKLQVLAPEGAVTLELLTQCLADHSRYDVFALVDACLYGDFARASKVLARLKGENAPIVVIVWALVKEIRQLSQVAFLLSQGEKKPPLFKRFRIWSKREPMVNAALRRLDRFQWQHIHHIAIETDQVVKGQRAPKFGDVWIQVEHLAAALCGVLPEDKAMPIAV